MSNKLISSNKNILIAGILILLIGIGILGYFWNKKEVNPNPLIFPSPTLTPPEEAWKTYINSQLGFLIKYPQMVLGLYRCSPYKPHYVPLKVFEDNKNGVTYITQKYYYQAPYSEELKDYTEPCEKITYSLEMLQGEWEKSTLQENKIPFSLKSEKTLLGLGILVKSIKSESELNNFIKENYGPTCFMENKKSWNQEGVYDIAIKGSDWAKNGDLEPVMTCGWNYKYKILYAPEKNKIMSVKLGQDCNFGTGYTSESYKCYDEEMINSFKF